MKRSTAAENQFIVNYEKMQTELKQDFNDIQDKIAALKAKLTARQFNKQFNNGYLRSALPSYFDCLELKQTVFEDLMNKDLGEWREIKEKKKREFEAKAKILSDKLKHW